MSVVLRGYSTVDGRTVEVDAEELKGGGSSEGGGSSSGILLKKHVDYTMPELLTTGVFTGYTTVPGHAFLAPTLYFCDVAFDGTPGSPKVCLFLESNSATWISGGKRFCVRSANMANPPADGIQYADYVNEYIRFTIASRLMIGVFQDLGSGNVGAAHPTKGSIEINGLIVPFS